MRERTWLGSEIFHKSQSYPLERLSPYSDLTEKLRLNSCKDGSHWQRLESDYANDERESYRHYSSAKECYS